MGIDKTLALIPLVMPQNRHPANYSNHATVRTMSLGKRTTKQNMHVATYTLCGWNQDSNFTHVHDGTHKECNTTAKTPRVKIQIDTKIQIIHKAK
jgi:hypothetical protein